MKEQTKTDEVKKNKKKSVHEEPNTTKLLTEDANYQIKEAYKTARTNILFALKQKEGCNKIILTSALAGEGKTTTTLNIAITFAMTHARVLVIDADLRKPKIHKYLDLENKNGIANYLGGFCKLESCIKTCKEFGLDCITSGSIPPNPAELLSSPLFEEALETLSQKYDFIFVDTPPINVVADALVISKLMNGVLFIARQKYSVNESVKRALHSLEFAEAKVLGFILNDAEKSERNYKYRYRYGKSYRYWSKYRYYDYRGYGYKQEGEKK